MADKDMKGNLKKHTLNLRAGDWDYIESIAKPNGLDTAVVIRTIISGFVDKKREEEKRLLGPAHPQIDVQL